VVPVTAPRGVDSEAIQGGRGGGYCSDEDTIVVYVFRKLLNRDLQ
jgi:hypothetical protein